MVKLSLHGARLKAFRSLALVVVSTIFVDSLLTGCQSTCPGRCGSAAAERPKSEPKYDVGRLGFWPPQAHPASTPELNRTIAARVSQLGMLFLEREMTFDSKKRDQYHGWFCNDPKARAMEGQLCSFLESKPCQTGTCTGKIWSGCSSGVFTGNYFVGPKHCVAGSDVKSLKAKVRIPRAGVVVDEIALVTTAFTISKDPYDVAIFKIKKHKAFPKMPMAEPVQGETVFGLGYPFLRWRTDTWPYEKTVGQLRVTIGKIVDANLQYKSFCRYTNEDDVVDLEAFALETDCSKVDYTSFKYQAREERAPILADTDMTFGMSGSPLFNAKGELLGIGSNVLSNAPGRRYDPSKSAVYVRSASVEALLKYLR